MKVFLDSSVIIAALLSENGGSAKILSICEIGLVKGYVSQAVYEEICIVLKRKFPAMVPLCKKVLQTAMVKIMRGKDQKFYKKARQWIKDPGDVKVVAAAKEIGVDYLITLDVKHFIRDVSVAEKSGLKIVTPADFLQKILGTMLEHTESD